MAQAGHGQDWEQFLVPPNNNPGVPLNAGDWQHEAPGDAPRVGDDGGRRVVFRRRSPTPLNLLCQIQVRISQRFSEVVLPIGVLCTYSKSHFHVSFHIYDRDHHG